MAAGHHKVGGKFCASQHVTLASAHFVALPTSDATRLDAQPFHIFLCRRLHLLLPVSMRTCRCCRQLDLFGQLEVAGARVCREAGSRGRRLDVVADGLTLWQGALKSLRFKFLIDLLKSIFLISLFPIFSPEPQPPAQGSSGGVLGHSTNLSRFPFDCGLKKKNVVATDSLSNSAPVSSKPERPDTDLHCVSRG